ncbi:MAG: V-type ATPase subunit, partial [Nanoarchaeota archaeon]
KVMKEFLESEIDVNNITTLIKLKHFGVDLHELPDYLIVSSFGEVKLSQLMKAKDVPQLIHYLKTTRFYPVLKDVSEDQDGLIIIEAALHKYLLKRTITLLHQNLFSVDVILAFLLAKEIEIMNLKRLVKGKQLGVQENMIEKVLVM